MKTWMYALLDVVLVLVGLLVVAALTYAALTDENTMWMVLLSQ